MKCPNGLHLRVAAEVVKMTQDRDATVHLKCHGCPKVNACSILELLTLGASVGDQIELQAEGPDEDDVVTDLTNLFEEGAGI